MKPVSLLLHESELTILSIAVREHYTPERVHQTMRADAELVLRKISAALKQFAERKGILDALVETLTDEEIELIRAHRTPRSRPEASRPSE